MSAEEGVVAGLGAEEAADPWSSFDLSRHRALAEPTLEDTGCSS